MEQESNLLGPLTNYLSYRQKDKAKVIKMLEHKILTLKAPKIIRLTETMEYSNQPYKSLKRI